MKIIQCYKKDKINEKEKTRVARLRYTLIKSPHREHFKELIQASRRRQLTSPSSIKSLNAKILYSSEYSS